MVLTEDLVERIERTVALRTDETVVLAGCRVRIVSSMENFPAMRHFSESARVASRDGIAAHFELWCLRPDDAPVASAELARHVDRTARARVFCEGYYVTENFGPPAYLLSRGRKLYVFSDAVDRLVWPYFVKYFLMRYAMESGALHLKAAALAIESAGTLVIGRGGAGKTVFLSQLCRRGAEFVSNSHVLVHNGCVEGVASAIRLRQTPGIADLVAQANATPGMVPEHVLVDPFKIFEPPNESRYPVRTLCFVEYGGPRERGVIPLSFEEACDCAELFALALNVYRLEEDLFDLLGGDYHRFAEQYRTMKQGLYALVGGARCHWVRGDMLDRSLQDEVLRVLQADD
jgi:hypothetical protein